MKSVFGCCLFLSILLAENLDGVPAALWCVCVPYAFEAAAPPPSSPTPPPHSSSSSSSSYFSTFSSPSVRHTLLSFQSPVTSKTQGQHASSRCFLCAQHRCNNPANPCTCAQRLLFYSSLRLSSRYFLFSNQSRISQARACTYSLTCLSSSAHSAP